MTDHTDLHALPLDKLLAKVKKAGGQRAFARLHNIPRTTLQAMITRAGSPKFHHRPAPTGRVETVRHGVRRFILSSAQDGTKVHEGFLRNLEAYRDYLAEQGPCEIMVAGFTYNKSLFEDHSKRGIYFHDRVKPYLGNQHVRLGDRIDWCAEMNTLPTAESPLQGFETYTRHRWGIFPHAKVQLKSVPTMKHEPAKIIMTTGAVTLPNYVPKRAGIKASFHHVIGAVLVEIRDDGVFFARHLLAEDDGSFYDLTTRVTKSVVTTGHRVEAINHGDLHVAQIDPLLSAAKFGMFPSTQRVNGLRVWKYTDRPSMMDDLRPRYQFLHDVCDFQARNHHNLADPHTMFEVFQQGGDSVERELDEVSWFIHNIRREDCQTVVVASNHDGALKTWLKRSDYRLDPLNAKFFLSCQLAVYEAIERRNHDFSIFEHVVTKRFHTDCAGVRFLREDESFKVLDIEKGMHGHLGANGARGTPKSYTRMGPKATTGHTHSCGIIDGIYTAGTNSKLDLGYNLGLSSWSHSDVITLPNGKRQIVTHMNGAYRL